MGQEFNQPGQYGQPEQSGQSGGYQPPPNYQPPGYQQQTGYGQPGYGQPGGGGYQQNPYQQAKPPYGAAATVNPNGPTSMGIDANVAAGLSYLLNLVGGLIFFFGEKQNRFVRFNAMQSIILNGSLLVVFFVLFILQFILYASVVLAVVGVAVSCLGFVLLPIAWGILHIVLAIFGFQGKTIRLPLIANYADKYANPTI